MPPGTLTDEWWLQYLIHVWLFQIINANGGGDMHAGDGMADMEAMSPPCNLAGMAMA